MKTILIAGRAGFVGAHRPLPLRLPLLEAVHG